MDTRLKYEFRRKLEELEKYKGRGTELITLYIPPDKNLADVASQLRNELSQAQNIKSKQTRTHVMAGLEAILQRLKYFRKPPENGMVIISGVIDLGGGKEKHITDIIEPPEPVPLYKYHCDSTFYLEPLKEMLVEKKVYGLIVLDRREATIGILRGKRIEALAYATSNVPGKHRQGGQSSVRFERLREIAIHEFYKRVGEKASEALLQYKDDLMGVLIGGPSPTKEEFYEGNYLHHEIQKKVIGLFDVSYTDESGLYELVEKASDALQELDIMREKKIMNRFLKEVVKDGAAAYGEDEVRKYLSMGAVDTLLISEDLRYERVKYRCPVCGEEKEVTIKENTSRDMVCEKDNVKMEEVERRDVILELAELAEAGGAKVEFISSDSEEGAMLKNAFGGIAAILRFKPEGW
ncbi:peptide chain release factor subunit 1 {aeRF-1} [Geoglobus ahangari]|uniref:Peptide chain release factor subunit 1 n=1 Tax=Geoglobus ahangari TaxID=113653 RepID=A0A0F7IGA2_9EURY|nr:peptide chain release factor aRF-1 [Geoglobus ahangari]AKG92577.1 peptide chain release factor subunit 1 {aeRF-1} [Geoglobus ahangari]NOY11084.1 peptide chain release factor 1 [Archaeoglobi archaeon]